MRSPSSERGWTVVELLLVGGLLGLLGSAVVPNLLEARVRNNEAAAVRTLRAVAAAQTLVAASGRLDTDGDGRGEFAFLLELSGEIVPRSGKPLVTGEGLPRGTPPGPVPQLFLRVDETGEALLSGYAFRVHLPGENGTVVTERRDGVRLGMSGAVSAAGAAEFWCAYAVPERRAEGWPPPSGRRTFFVHQTGIVTAARADYGVRAQEGFVPSRPTPGAAFAAPGSAGAITGAPALEADGRDGKVWREVR